MRACYCVHMQTIGTFSPGGVLAQMKAQTSVRSVGDEPHSSTSTGDIELSHSVSKERLRFFEIALTYATGGVEDNDNVQFNSASCNDAESRIGQWSYVYVTTTRAIIRVITSHRKCSCFSLFHNTIIQKLVYRKRRLDIDPITNYVI